ncbi:MAG: hypothetical protein Q9227_007982 [Pyrenula ochraceoflavens]
MAAQKRAAKDDSDEDPQPSTSHQSTPRPTTATSPVPRKKRREPLPLRRVGALEGDPEVDIIQWLNENNAAELACQHHRADNGLDRPK